MNLKIYKRSQGKNSRLSTAIVLFAIVAIGCWKLYGILESTGNPIVAPVVSAAVAGIFAALIYWLSNKPAIADFLIAAEGEIKKVSWSSRKEIVNSTIIVITVVIVMAAGLGLVDLGFQLFFRNVVNLY